MRSGLSFAVGGLAAVSLLAGAAIWAEAQRVEFDPADPFARLASAGEWVAKFRTGVPDIDANDRFRNLTSEAWAAAWEEREPGQENLLSDQILLALSGSGGSGIRIRSPYPYTSAEEHFAAWRNAASGGTRHTRATLPDWSGDWQGTDEGVLGRGALVRDVWNATSKEYQPAFQQLLTAELEGRHWWPGDACLPDGIGRFYSLGGTFHFMMDPTLVLIDKDRPNSETRYVYVDGRGFLPPDYAFPMWYGQSQGFWDGDDLIVWTRDVKPWLITHALPEYSDELQLIERIRKIGDEILVDITLYDAKAFAFPWHDVVVFRKLADWKEAPPTFYECVFTNNVYHDANGELQMYHADDLHYRDASDPRPWIAVFERGEKARAAQGAAGQ